VIKAQESMMDDEVFCGGKNQSLRECDQSRWGFEIMIMKRSCFVFQSNLKVLNGELSKGLKYYSDPFSRK